MLGKYFKKKTIEGDGVKPEINIEGCTFLDTNVFMCEGWGTRTLIPVDDKVRLYLHLKDFSYSEISVELRRRWGYKSQLDVSLARGKVKVAKSMHDDQNLHKAVDELISEFKKKEDLYAKLDEYRAVIHSEINRKKEKAT